MFAKDTTASLSWSVVVGDFKSKVSEIIAESIIPAISCGISISFSLYICHIMVLVQPTGAAR